MFLSRIQGRHLGRLSGRDRSRRRHHCAAASGIEGEYRSIAEICLSRKARLDAQKKKELMPLSLFLKPVFVFGFFPLDRIVSMETLAIILCLFK